ncbi:hypothetical protein PIB30_050310 [Stylosanthes scabra]|uniref:glucan endo-1,3-beta-D-glucosidase n=1 Tax=Stylosanthes scabra TaxID=79078 RepID=A0ABU6RIG8_9FABA|nr:hypothetical protein [Stylosanthes scabra]
MVEIVRAHEIVMEELKRRRGETFTQTSGSDFGINYGQIANNLPSPSRVVVLIKSLNISRLKLYDADPNVLSAFSNSNVELDALVNLGLSQQVTDSPDKIPLSYALFQPNSGSIDPGINLHYDNMLYAQIDAVYFAIKALGHTDIVVRISETSWPSKGSHDKSFIAFLASN